MISICSFLGLKGIKILPLFFKSINCSGHPNFHVKFLVGKKGRKDDKRYVYDEVIAGNKPIYC